MHWWKLLRRVSTRVARLPGGARVMEPLVSRLATRGPVLVVGDFDGDLEIELDTAALQASEIFWYGAYNRGLLPLVRALLHPGDCVVDAGANIGEISLVAAKRVGKAGRVLAFEPLDALADVLQRNADRNGLSQVEVLRLALSDEEGVLPLYLSDQAFRGRRHEGLGTLYPSDTRSRAVAEVPLRRLDDVLAERGVERVHLLKVDVEGAELPVLRGAARCLEQDRPWVLVEVQDETARAAGYSADELLAWLEGFDYRFFRPVRRGRLEAMGRATLRPFQNVLAVPPGEAPPL